MGQESSQPRSAPTGPPQTIQSRSLPALASYILAQPSLKCVVMTGAGISTSAGIPDFRSKDTGIYSRLAGLDLSSPEDIFDITFFRSNPAPFFALAKELYPGKFHPTLSHAFIALLARKKMLHMLFTQNIDCLERAAGVPADRIVEAHGSFATNSCIECKSAFDKDCMHDAVMAGEVPHCRVPQCNGIVKPDITFFGEQLSRRFFENVDAIREADLVIVMGTSLSVQPVASLPGRVRDGVPRLLINREEVGDLGMRSDDVVLLEDCDAGVVKLAEELGWTKELMSIYAEVGGEKAKARKEMDEADRKKAVLEEEVDHLTKEVEESLKVTKKQETKMETGAEVEHEGERASSEAKTPSALTPPTTNLVKDKDNNTDDDQDLNIKQLTTPKDQSQSHTDPFPTPATGAFPSTTTIDTPATLEKVSSSLSLVAEGRAAEEEGKAAERQAAEGLTWEEQEDAAAAGGKM